MRPFFSAFAVDAVTAAAAADAAEAAAAATAAEAALPYLQGARTRTRDSATADRCATHELHSPPNQLQYSALTPAMLFEKRLIFNKHSLRSQLKL